jgi:hypothetical protein
MFYVVNRTAAKASAKIHLQADKQQQLFCFQ